MTPLSELIIPRLPHFPKCTNNPRHGLLSRPAELAVSKSHIQLNPFSLRHWLLFDIDCEKAAIAWEIANLPPPNWIATNPANGHAHYGYLLKTPLVTTDAGRKHPLQYGAAIESAYTLRLKADPAYGALISKNPLCLTWKNWLLHDHHYSLDELADWVTLKKSKHAHATFVPKSGIWRNVTLFDTLRAWAYNMVLTYKSFDSTTEQWLQALLGQAEVINAKFTPPLAQAEVRGVVKSVGKWVWRVFTEAAFSEIQSKRAKKRWAKEKATSTEKAQPWVELGISRRTYYYRKKADLEKKTDCTDAISDN